MHTPFQIKALDAVQFAPFLAMNEADLKPHNAKWVTADTDPGFPCRVSLQDANIGERVLLLPFNHHNVSSPYRASGPVFIREHAKTAKLAINQVPKMLRHRQLSLRAYDQYGMMLATEVVPGNVLETCIEKMFEQTAVSYVHIHNAGPGCFNCAVVRA